MSTATETEVEGVTPETEIEEAVAPKKNGRKPAPAKTVKLGRPKKEKVVAPPPEPKEEEIEDESELEFAPAAPPQPVNIAQVIGPMGPAQCQKIETILKQINDLTRLRVLELCNDERTVNTICALIGASQPAVSHHISILRNSGLIQRRRAGKNNFYRVSDLGLAMIEMVHKIVSLS